jgi:hypothetical protein
MSQIRIESSACQWLIIYQTKVLTNWFLKKTLKLTIARYDKNYVVDLKESICK